MIQTIRDISIICVCSITFVFLIYIFITSLTPSGGIVQNKDNDD